MTLMLSTVRITSPAMYLECRPDVERLLEEHRPRLSADDLRRQLFQRPAGPTERDHAEHVLVLSAGRAVGLVPCWRRHRDRRQCVLGLGASGGPLVVGRNRTLALLGLMRTFVAQADEWDVLLASGSGVAGDLRRLETAARCEKVDVRTVEVRNASVLAVMSPASWRAWWNSKLEGDAGLVGRWDLESVAAVNEGPRPAIPREVIPVLRVVSAPEAEEDLPPQDKRPPRRPPAKRPMLRVVRPS